MINHVHAQVSKYEMPQNKLIFLGCIEAEVISLVSLKISWTHLPPPSSEYVLNALLGKPVGQSVEFSKVRAAGSAPTELIS